jgi:hypothetical protein
MSRDSVTGFKRTMQSKSSIFKNLYIYTMKAQLSDVDMLNNTEYQKLGSRTSASRP